MKKTNSVKEIIFLILSVPLVIIIALSFSPEDYVSYSHRYLSNDDSEFIYNGNKKLLRLNVQCGKEQKRYFNKYIIEDLTVDEVFYSLENVDIDILNDENFEILYYDIYNMFVDKKIDILLTRCFLDYKGEDIPDTFNRSAFMKSYGTQPVIDTLKDVVIDNNGVAKNNDFFHIDFRDKSTVGRKYVIVIYYRMKGSEEEKRLELYAELKDTHIIKER